MTQTFTVETQKDGWKLIDEKIKLIVAQSGVRQGLCLIYLPHTTAAIVATSSWDTRGIEDALSCLKAKISPRINYEHPYSPYTSAARTKTELSGCGRTFIIKDGKLLLGHSQSVMVFDFDGPRTRTVSVTVVEKEMYFYSVPFLSRYSQMTDVTQSVYDVVRRSGIKNGCCHIADIAATSGLMLCGRDEALAADIWADLERFLPTRADFKHRETASDAVGHIKTFISGTQIQLPVCNGKPVIGSEQRVVYAEFDGPRPRDIKVAVYAEE